MERYLHYLSPLKLMLGLLVLTTFMNLAWAADQAPAEPTAATETAAGVNDADAKFSPTDLFPSWDNDVYRVQGVAGRNEGELGTGENKLFLDVVPVIIALLIKLAAPAVFVMMVYAGLRFIYSSDNEEERANAQKFFLYTGMGLVMILISYSIMRALYFLYAGA